MTSRAPAPIHFVAAMLLSTPWIGPAWIFNPPGDELAPTTTETAPPSIAPIRPAVRTYDPARMQTTGAGCRIDRDQVRHVLPTTAVTWVGLDSLAELDDWHEAKPMRAVLTTRTESGSRKTRAIDLGIMAISVLWNLAGEGGWTESSSAANPPTSPPGASFRPGSEALAGSSGRPQATLNNRGNHPPSSS